MKIPELPSFEYVEQGLRSVNKNDSGSAHKMLDEWPEDIFITGPGLASMPVSDAVKAILIFDQMKRVDKALVLNKAHASSVAEVFSQAADEGVCKRLAEDWWTNGQSPTAHLLVKGEKSLKEVLPEFWQKPPDDAGKLLVGAMLSLISSVAAALAVAGSQIKPVSLPSPYEITVTDWDTKKVRAKLFSKENPRETSQTLEFSIRLKDILITTPDNIAWEKVVKTAEAPTELLVALVAGLAPYLPENTKDIGLRKLREQAEKEENKSVRPIIEALQAVFARRAKALAKAESLMAGATPEKVGRRTKKNLADLAKDVPEASA
ncbi:hypothetical protein ACFL6C_12740 [Myxococcota bacterium]